MPKGIYVPYTTVPPELLNTLIQLQLILNYELASSGEPPLTLGQLIVALLDRTLTPYNNSVQSRYDYTKAAAVREYAEVSLPPDCLGDLTKLLTTLPSNTPAATTTSSTTGPNSATCTDRGGDNQEARCKPAVVPVAGAIGEPPVPGVYDGPAKAGVGRGATSKKTDGGSSKRRRSTTIREISAKQSYDDLTAIIATIYRKKRQRHIGSPSTK